MFAPLIYVCAYTVKPGNTGGGPPALAELVDFVETNEPRVIAFHTYLDRDATRSPSSRCTRTPPPSNSTCR